MISALRPKQNENVRGTPRLGLCLEQPGSTISTGDLENRLAKAFLSLQYPSDATFEEPVKATNLARTPEQAFLVGS